MQRARGAYFANRHDTFWKELNFNFPEHQKILKFIKISWEEIEKIWRKKIEILRFFSKSRKFSKIFENLDFFQYDFQLIFSKKIENFPIFRKNRKISKNFQIVFLNDFFMDFIFFDVLESWSSALSKKYYVYLWNMLP